MSGVEIIQWILYAVDVILFCKSVKEAEQLLTIINANCVHLGLTTSFKKTKTQVFNDNALAIKPTLFSIGKNLVENVKEFVYLGQVITTDNDGCFTVHRVARATAKFNELRTVLKDTRVNLRTHRKLLEAC